LLPVYGLLWKVSWLTDRQGKSSKLTSMESRLITDEHLLLEYIDIIKLRNRVYSVASLCPRFMAVITAMRVVMSFQTWDEVEFCFIVCRTAIGAHIELH
jgi:hypothetical protein